MVKGYLRYRFDGDFGVVTSAESNVAFDNTGTKAITGSNEFLAIWEPRTGEIVSKFSASFMSENPNSTTGPVTRVCSHPLQRDVSAVGYFDGSVRLWDTSTNCTTNSLLLTLNGHKSGIAHLEFSMDGHFLATGGWDTDIVIWDLISQSGLFRLRGHRNQISCLRFLYSPTNIQNDPTPAPQTSNDDETADQGKKKKKKKKRAREDEEPITSPKVITESPFIELSRTPVLLISGSKDGTVKVWDLTTQWCIQTIFDSAGEICSLAVNPTQASFNCSFHELLRAGVKGGS